jgi:hypothetical protein
VWVICEEEPERRGKKKKAVNEAVRRNRNACVFLLCLAVLFGAVV